MAIYSLIACGIVVIIYAGNITSLDFGPDLDTRLAARISERNTANARAEVIHRIVGSDWSDYRNEIRKFIASWQGRQSADPQKYEEALQFDEWSVPTGDELGDGVSNKVKSDDVDIVQIKFEFHEFSDSLTLSRQQWADFEKAIRSTTFHTRLPLRELKQLASEHRDLDVQVQKLNGVIAELNGARARQAALGPTPTSDTSDSPSLPRLIQTNITRFGTLLMIGFLVGILVPLYKYNLRLSAYYLARADALKLMPELKSVGFVELVSALTPPIDFSKAPQTPTEQIIELMRSALGREQKP